MRTSVFTVAVALLVVAIWVAGTAMLGTPPHIGTSGSLMPPTGPSPATH